MSDDVDLRRDEAVSSSFSTRLEEEKKLTFFPGTCSSRVLCRATPRSSIEPVLQNVRPSPKVSLLSSRLVELTLPPFLVSRRTNSRRHLNNQQVHSTLLHHLLNIRPVVNLALHSVTVESVAENDGVLRRFEGRREKVWLSHELLDLGGRSVKM